MKIKKELLLELFEAMKNSSPNEFFAFLGSDSGKEIDHYIIVPYFYQAPDSVSYRTDLLPFDSSVKGTIHSHPGYSAYPSRADIETFRKKGNIHLIVAYPYSFETIRAYNQKGDPIQIELS